MPKKPRGLVLTRRENEAARIFLPGGEVIAVTVDTIQRGSTPQVRLRFEAPPSVKILRDELGSPEGPAPSPQEYTYARP